MSTLLFANNANTTLAGAITNTAVTLNVQSGAGALFPNPGSSQYFVASLLDQATQTVREIIWVTARSGDTFTVIRGQEGTSAQNWLAGDFLSNQLTAGQMSAFQQGSSSSISATSLIYYGVDTGTADAMVITTSPTIASYTDGMVFETTPAHTNLTATPQANICALGSRQFANALPGYIVAGQKLIFSYDGNLNKFVLTTLPNTATQTMRGIARSATPAEASAGVTSGSVPAFITPEELQANISPPVATTTTRGIARQATITEATNGVTSGSVPAFITPEGLAAATASGAHGVASFGTPGAASWTAPFTGYVTVKGVGGGGGGGSSGVSNALWGGQVTTSQGLGGWAGAYFEDRVAVTSGTAYALTIGGGGTGGGAVSGGAGNTGSNGGTTSMFSRTAPGGPGGLGAGQTGSPTVAVATGASINGAGNAAVGAWGAAGVYGGANPSNGAAPGAGGGSGAGAYVAGANGANGQITLEW